MYKVPGHNLDFLWKQGNWYVCDRTLIKYGTYIFVHRKIIKNSICLSLLKFMLLIALVVFKNCPGLYIAWFMCRSIHKFSWSLRVFWIVTSIVIHYSDAMFNLFNYFTNSYNGFLIASPNDIAYVFSGYAPLSIRLVQHAIRSGW